MNPPTAVPGMTNQSHNAPPSASLPPYKAGNSCWCLGAILFNQFLTYGRRWIGKPRIDAQNRTTGLLMPP